MLSQRHGRSVNEELSTLVYSKIHQDYGIIKAGLCLKLTSLYSV